MDDNVQSKTLIWPKACEKRGASKMRKQKSSAHQGEESSGLWGGISAPVQKGNKKNVRQDKNL